MEEYNKYKVAFTFFHSLEGLYGQIAINDLKKIPVLVVLDMDSHPGLADFALGDRKAFIKIILENSPDLIVTYNDKNSLLTKISLLLGTMKIRVQDDNPSNIKWKASYTYDTESPLTIISTSSKDFPESKYHRRFQEILQSEEIKNYHGDKIWECSSFKIVNGFGIKDTVQKGKDIDIVFIGDVGGITKENIREYLASLLPDIPQEAVNGINETVLDLAETWEYNEAVVLNEVLTRYDIEREKWDKITNAALTIALPSLRRINILKGFISKFGHKYNIKLYGGYQIAKDISSDHYEGMAFGVKKEDVFRRSKIQVHVHNNLQYNAARMLESYRYSCLCLSNFSVNDAIYGATAYIAGESIPFVPKFKNIQELYDLCGHYLQNEKERIDTVEKVLSLIPKEVDVSEKVNAYIRFFDYVKNMNIKVNPFDFSLLKYDSEVIELCKLTEDCCMELGLAEKSAYYKRLKEHFINVLETGYNEKPEQALQFAYYQYKSMNNPQKALEIIDTHCEGLEGAKVLKGRVLVLQGEYHKAVELLLSFSCGAAEDEANRLCYLAAAYQSIGDHRSALDNMMKTLDLNYPMPHINYYIGFSYFSINDFKKAKEYLLINTGIEKLFLPAFELLGDICFARLGEFDIAYDAYNTAGGIALKYPERKRKERCIYFLEKMALCKLHSGRLGEAVMHLNIIVEQFDSGHINSHLKLFFILLISTTRDELWNREVSFIRHNGINVKALYQRVRMDFPEELAKTIDKALESAK